MGSIVIRAFIVLLCGISAALAEPYDDFDGSDRLEASRWGRQLEFARVVNGGRLHLRQRRVKTTAANSVRFIEPSTIRSIAATVNVVHADDSGAVARARLFGYFCDTDSTANERTNEVLAELSVGSFHGELAVRAQLVLCENEDCLQRQRLFSDLDTFPAPVLGSDNPMSLGFDTSTNAYQFAFNGQTLTVRADTVPALASCDSTQVGTKLIGTHVDESTNDDDLADEGGEIIATFDDIAVNGALYDDFNDGLTLDPGRWREALAGDQEVTIVTADGTNRVYLATQHCGSSDGFAETPLRASEPAIQALRAETLVGPTEADRTAGDEFTVRARVSGIFYNDGSAGGRVSGNVQLETSLTQRFSDTPERFAECFARRCLDSSCSEQERLFTHNFGDWDPARAYPLYIGFDEVTRRLVCGLGEDLYVHPIETPMYPPFEPAKGLWTVVSGVEDGSCASIAAEFDDVEINLGLRDTERFVISPTRDLVTNESPATFAKFSVRLAVQPTAQVVIPLTNTRSTEGLLGATQLTFTPDNWSTPMDVFVTGQDDDNEDGDWSYNIILGPTQSTDPQFNGKYPDHVEITNIDNEGPLEGVFLGYGDPRNKTTCENNGRNRVALKLTRRPQGTGTEVTVAVASNRTSEAIVEAPGALLFNFDNWNIPQYVAIVGQDDTIIDGNQRYSITAVSSSADEAYNGKRFSLSFTSLDDDTDGGCVPPIMADDFESSIR